MEKNLHVPGYSVEQLSRDLCMERTGLYRKLVAMLDQSPSLFIRNIRLQRAAQLILEGSLSITEIAERTGFSSSSYLSKCFQEMYGCRPSEYAEKMQEINLSVVPFQQDCCHLKGIQGYFCSIILKEP